jgi:hypothetical protein
MNTNDFMSLLPAICIACVVGIVLFLLFVSFAKFNTKTSSITEYSDSQKLSPASSKLRIMFLPLSARGVPVWAVYMFSIIGMIYILNPTAGIFELIPDNFPLIGNLDEGGAFLIIWFGLVEFFEGKNY